MKMKTAKKPLRKPDAKTATADEMRRLLLKIGVKTRCRVTYDTVAEFFGAKCADHLIALAVREGVVP